MFNPYFVTAHYLPHQFTVRSTSGEKFKWHREGLFVSLIDQAHYMDYPFQSPEDVTLHRWHALDVQAEKEAWATLDKRAQVSEGSKNPGVSSLIEALNQARCVSFLATTTRHLENIRAEYRSISLSIFEDSRTMLIHSALAATPIGAVHLRPVALTSAFSTKTIEQQLDFHLEPFSVSGRFGCQVTPKDLDESGTTWNVQWELPDYMAIIRGAPLLVEDFVAQQKAKGRKVLVSIVYR